MLYIGHQNALKPELTVRSNILFWCNLYDTRELVDTALHYFGLEPFSDIPCGELSAGWQRKVALTRLITVPSAIWLLDEPMTHLDEEGEAQVKALITGKCGNGGIVLMSTHDIENKSFLSLKINDYKSTMNVEE
mgnify:CR=1 FL=1